MIRAFADRDAEEDEATNEEVVVRLARFSPMGPKKADTTPILIRK